MGELGSRVRITVDDGPPVEVGAGEVVVLGRDVDATLRVSDPLVSRRHARLVHDGSWILEDLGSANGTWMAGQEIQRVRLHEVHEARLGDPVDAPVVRFELVEPVRSQTLDRRSAGAPSLDPGAPLPGTTADLVTIGRNARSDLHLDDPMVSSHHARLQTHEGRRWLVDLQSTNQTIVNGLAISSQVLEEGDKVLIGNTHLRFQGGGLVQEPMEGLVVRDAVLAIRSGRRIVDRVSFTVDRPSVVAVIGPSGAGKSSLLRLLTGQVRPSSGVVDFRGASMVSQRTAFRGDIGVVPQHTIAHERLTARQALDATARLRFADDVTTSGRRVRVAEVLEQLGLTPHADTPVARLSGGQQRRVSIAMELLTEPTMLILDEPTSGLDPSLVLQIMQLLRQFADGGKQVLVVTHDLDHLDLVDRVVVLRAGGTVAYEGPPGGVFAHFGRSSWAQVFTDLAVPAQHPPGAASPSATSASFDVPAPPVDASTILRHARTVASRHVRLLLADPALVALTLAMPVLLAVLALAVPGRNGLAPAVDATGPDPNPGRLLAILTIGAAFLGLAGAMRELVRERPIYVHERAAGLPPLSYLLAKSVVLAFVAVVQSTLLVLVVLAFKKNPRDGVLLPWTAPEVLLAVAATSVCCVMLGLAVSARLANSEQATPPLVLLVMAQLVLCGGLFPIAGRPGLEQLSWLAPGRWGYAAAAATTDLTVALPPDQRDGLWDHEPLVWILSLVCLVVLGTLFWIAAFAGVRRRESAV